MKNKTILFIGVLVITLVVGYFFIDYWYTKSMKQMASGFAEVVEDKPFIFASLVFQTELAEAVREYWIDNGEFPSSIQLLQLPKDKASDPWGSPYVIMQIDQNRFVVQSFGKVRKNMLGKEDIGEFKTGNVPRWENIRDNIILIDSMLAAKSH